jgi:hypothetical protein
MLGTIDQERNNGRIQALPRASLESSFVDDFKG